MATDMAEGQQQTSRMPAGGSATDQQPDSDQAAEEVWDEERLEKAMKTLKEMHIQVSRSFKALRFRERQLLMSPFSYASFERQFPDS